MKTLHWCKLCHQPGNAISIIMDGWYMSFLCYICFVCMMRPNISNKECEECTLAIGDQQWTSEKMKTIEYVNLSLRWDD